MFGIMKTALLFFLFSFSQILLSQQVVEIRLVDPNIGYPIYEVNGGLSIGSQSNDVGLNALFEANNVTSYVSKGGHPYYVDSIYEIYCNGDVNQLRNSLAAYTTVVENAKVSQAGTFSDALTTRILDTQIGIPTGVSNEIITTNDSGLNQIFEDFNVFYYDLWCSSCSNIPTLNRVYNIVCDCDATTLLLVLNNYTSVIEPNQTELASAYYLLGNESFDANKPSIYPNPFSTSFSIQTKATILHYGVFDVTGKQIINTASKSALDNQVQQLTSGIYVLKLQSENGEIFNHKLIKQ
jgi:hypothetical protein